MSFVGDILFFNLQGRPYILHAMFENYLVFFILLLYFKPGTMEYQKPAISYLHNLSSNVPR